MGAQLPILIRGVYYEGWKLSGKPVKGRHKSEFLDHVPAAFRDDPTDDPEKVTRAVFKVLARHITADETENVKNLLPKTSRSCGLKERANSSTPPYLSGCPRC